jgi:dihydropteroate synthase
MVRVHDVRETAQALAIWQAVAEHQATELLPSPRV